MILSLFTVAAVFSQPATTPAAPPAAPAAVVQDQSAPGMLGRRIAAVRAETTVAPILVLVTNNQSFNAAITNWHTDKGRALFPILFDLDTQDSRENIARFVRAFKPSRIIRFSVGEAGVPSEPATAETAASALYSTFGVKDEAAYFETLAKRGAGGPVGAVVAEPGNSAALALAAAYGQALIFADPPAPAGGAINLPAADKLSAAITSRLSALKLSFAGQGDQIDAVTLCFDVPANVVVGSGDAPAHQVPQLVAKAGESLSLTDIVGRVTNNNRQDRWAYASQLTGTQAQATYRAMCAIFLQPTTATAFNGYERTGEFGKYNPADGIAALKQAGLETGIIDRPGQSADDWRQWASGSFATDGRFPAGAGKQPPGGELNTDLFLVNTMGNSDFFQLQPGLCYAGDAPFLSLPAAVNFTHSWSLQHSGNPTTVGGRWLDRGAYCYVGSVWEPYLSAFVPQSEFAQRLTRGWPIAAAARVQATDRPANPFAAPWRVAVLGDALWTLGPALKRTTDLPNLPGATDLDAQLRADGQARRFSVVLDTLTMLGRDKDAAKWAKVLCDGDEKIDHQTALRAVLIAYRAGDTATLVKAAQKVDATDAVNPAIADAVWHALWPRMSVMNAEQAQLLARFVRPYSYAWDTTMAATALKRSVNADVARAFFEKQYDKAPREDIKRRLDEAKGPLFR